MRVGGLGPRESWIAWATLPALLAAVVVGASLLLWSGDDPGDGAGHPDVDLALVEANGSMAALVAGRLVVDRRCVVLETDADLGAVDRVLVLWPAGSEVVGDGDDLAVRPPLGADVPLGGPAGEYAGGFVNETDVLPEQLAGIEALATCAARLDVTHVFQMALDPAG